MFTFLLAQQGKVFYGKTRKEVQEKLNQALYEQRQGTLITAPKQTLTHFLTDWLENTQKGQFAVTFLKSVMKS